MKDKGDVFQRGDKNVVQAADPKSPVKSGADATVETLFCFSAGVQQQHFSGMQLSGEKLQHAHFKTQHTPTQRTTVLAGKMEIIKQKAM